MVVWAIVEEIEIGGPRDRVARKMLATEKTYGGNLFPLFATQGGAERFIKSQSSIRGFKAVKLQVKP